MHITNRKYLTAVAIGVGALGIMLFPSTPSVAQDAPAKPSVAQSIRHNIATQVATITVETTRGEPEAHTATVDFDRDVEACWVTLIGHDVKFRGSTEKSINRVMVSVDPFAKVINGRKVEVSGKLGIRDGSGNWDDSYEGTITVAVTAVLSN